MVLEFDGTGEIGEGSTELRHGETAEDSGALLKVFVQHGGANYPKPSFLCKACFCFTHPIEATMSHTPMK